MTKKDKLECLMLISALESFCISRKESARFPDYLIEQIANAVDKLGADILEVEEEPVADSAITDRIFKRLTNMEVDQLLASNLSPHEIICAVENRLALKNDAKYV